MSQLILFKMFNFLSFRMNIQHILMYGKYNGQFCESVCKFIQLWLKSMQEILNRETRQSMKRHNRVPLKLSIDEIIYVFFSLHPIHLPFFLEHWLSSISTWTTFSNYVSRECSSHADKRHLMYAYRTWKFQQSNKTDWTI